jgi:biopolymer transport protein ExbB
MATESAGLVQFWAQADGVSHFIGYVLLIASVLSWYFILLKGLQNWRLRSYRNKALTDFWHASNLDSAASELKARDQEGIFSGLAERGIQASRLRTDGSIQAGVDQSELVTRALRQAINEAATRLEAGLTFLASVGSTAPFIGLFGTVWGIYNALLGISAEGTIAIDKVAGPVGEALIMTAAGLAVAIPAVLAYNAYVRMNRLTLLELDGFAHDLHALLTTGSRGATGGAPTGKGKSTQTLSPSDITQNDRLPGSGHVGS